MGGGYGGTRGYFKTAVIILVSPLLVTKTRK